MILKMTRALTTTLLALGCLEALPVLGAEPEPVQRPVSQSLTLSIGGHWLQGEENATVGVGNRSGITLSYKTPGRGINFLELRGTLLPASFRFSDTPTCGSDFPGEGEPTSDQIAEVVSCEPPHPAYVLAAGMGKRMKEQRKSFVDGSLLLEARFMPDAVVPSTVEDIAGGLEFANLWMAGPVAEVRFGRIYHEGERSVNVGLELSAGALFVPVETGAYLTFPVTVGFGIGMSL